MDEQLKLLEKLCLSFGPTGCEDEVAQTVLDEIGNCGFAVKRDFMGNIFVTIPGRSSEKRMMLSAHMDEVGFMINEITGDGKIRFDMIGCDPRVLSARNVVLGNEKKRVRGVISCKPIHLMSAGERVSATKSKDMQIDIGAKSKGEAEGMVSVGDFGTFDAPFLVFGEDNKMLCSKAIDDRAGCAILCLLIKKYAESGEKPAFDTVCAFTVREEVGLGGARTAAYGIAPDYAVVLESTAVGDIADAPAHLRVADCGEGPAISLMDRSTIYDRDFVDFAMKTAKENGIKAQLKRYVSGGNDAGSIHKSRGGVKTLAVSLPCRYLHTQSNVIAISDYFEAQRLISEICDKMEII